MESNQFKKKVKISCFKLNLTKFNEWMSQSINH